MVGSLNGLVGPHVKDLGVFQVLQLVLQLRGERPSADPGGVSLDHSDAHINGLRRDTQSSAHAPDGGGRRCDKWVGTKINIQQRCVGTFDQNLVPSTDLFMHECHRINNLRTELLGVSAVPLNLRVNGVNTTLGPIDRVKRLLGVVLPEARPQHGLLLSVSAPRVPESSLRPADELTEVLFEFVKSKQIPKTQAISHGFGRVSRTDASLGGAN
mmetsp:Transcript_37025/g.80904  ORF Transcript_37025/g.80904 Transcript_37025/m.80904 type:complete len:213 (+) Transcript_37025:581-1219(+)